MTREEELHRTWQAMMAERKINVSFDTFLTIIDVADEHPKNPWVSVEERLPDSNKPKWSLGSWIPDLLVRFKDGTYETAHFVINRKKFINASPDHNTIVREITHWMPIPKGGEE